MRSSSLSARGLQQKGLFHGHWSFIFTGMILRVDPFRNEKGLAGEFRQVHPGKMPPHLQGSTLACFVTNASVAKASMELDLH